MSLTFRASSSLTITLASLASSSGLTAGRCSAMFDNSTNLDELAAAALQTMTGTSPTAGVIELWAFHERKDGTWPDLFTAAYSGTDGGFTARSRDVLMAGARLIRSVTTDTTSDRPYTVHPTDLAQRLGPIIRRVGFFVTHSTVAALNATAGNHDLTVKSAYWA